ncbi:MAG: hypothetical protein ACRDPF_09635, partial [Streptosporangiaceae bacterium]
MIFSSSCSFICPCAGAQHDAFGVGKLQRRLREAFRVRAGDDDLGAAQAQVERIQQRHVAEQIALGHGEDVFDQRIGFAAERVVAGKHGEPHEILRGDRVGVGDGLVDRRMRPQQQVAGVVGGKIIAARVGVGVMRVEARLPDARSLERRAHT